MSDPRWYFTEEQLANSPSRKCGVNAEQELSYRQRAANLIQEMGQRLQVSQLCINTAIVYMHRFYAFHSFTLFHRNSIAAAAFFLAAKVEEQPRKLEHVIKILNICLEKNDNTRDTYAEQAQELVFNENVLLQTLGFDVAIDHPHTHVVKACQLFNIVTVSRELRQTCYFMASNSLHLTTMCLKYKPTVVAAFCIYIACKWSRWEIPDSSEGKAWYSYVDENVTTEILKKLTDEYLQILERSPSKFKSKMKAITSNGQAGINQNPSVTRDDGPSTSSLHKPHEKHHHHRSTSSNHVNRKQPETGLGSSSSSSSSIASKQSQSSSQAGPNYKNQLPTSGSHMQRPRPSSGSSQQPPYLGNNVNETSQRHVNEERTQHRQVVNQETPTFPMLQRQIDSSRPRQSSNQASSMSSQQQQSSQHQQTHQKPTNHDQRHSQSMGAKPIPDYHHKSMKPPQPEFPSRSSSSTHSQQQPPQSQQHKKQPSWAQQQPGVVSQQKPPAQSHIQSSQTQPNLSSSSTSGNGNSNNRNMSQSTLPSYNESTKQSSSSQPVASNDYWFNDKLQDATAKVASPPRPTKSMFSPSPEHEPFDRTKLLMMQSANAKRKNSPSSDKSERRSSTPVKKEKRSENTPNPSQNAPQQKLQVPKLEGGTSASQLMSDQNKKRPFSTIDDGDLSRDSKSRKIEPTIKIEPTSLVSGAMKQPIETNPDIVKSLLKECYTGNSKFDSYGMDSPLDVINPEPTQSVPSMLATSSFPPQVKLEPELSAVKDEPQDNGYGDDHSRSKKSKKERKKDKHKHKKNKKSHKSEKSDREDRKDPLKIILSHKSDSPPEGMPTGSLKIKIPMNNFDVSKPDLPPAGSSLPQAPLKLKISKEKIGGFNNSSQNLSDGGSSSSSSHKKKDKDRSKPKSSKHGNNNNNSDYKDAGYQHQQHLPPQQQPMNKMNSQASLQQQQQMVNNNQSQNPYDYGSLFNDNSFSQHGYFSQQQMPTTNSQGMEYHSFNDFFHNTSVNYSNHNASSNGGNKK